MHADAPLPDAARWLQAAAGRAYTQVVRRTYRSLTGDAARDEPLKLVARLADAQRLSPEASFLLLSVGQALQDVGALRRDALSRAVLSGAWRAARSAIR